MQEKLMALWQVIEPRLRIVMFALFLALLGVIFFLKATETGGVEPWVPPASAALDPAATPMAASVEQKLYPETSVVETFPYSPLAISMFNFKNVQDEVEKQATVRRLFEEAQALNASGQYRQALEKCEQALAIRPNYLDALNLKKSLQEKLDAAASATPAAQ